MLRCERLQSSLQICTWETVQMFIRWIFLLACVTLLLFTGGPSLADDLSSAIKAITEREDFQQAHWGVLVVDLEDGETLYEHQSEQLFAPASVTKLFSVASALDALGADYQFKTPLYARGKIDEQGVLHGDLILVASG